MSEQRSRIYRRLKFTTILFLWLVSAFYSAEAFGQNDQKSEEKFPVPSGNRNQLFYLQRTENINTIVYELNEKEGNLNVKNPIHIFWIMYADKEQHEELNELEKKFAYGIDIHPIEKDGYEFKLIAYPKVIMQLVKDQHNKYHVYVNLSQKRMLLHRAYIKVKEGGSKFRPNVEYIELSGIDTSTEKEMTERVMF